MLCEVLSKFAAQITAMGGRIDEVRVLDKKTVLIKINGREEVYEIRRGLQNGYVNTFLVRR